MNESLHDTLRLDIFAGGGAVVLSEIIGMWAMSKVDWPHMVEVFMAILIAAVVSYAVSRTVTIVQTRRAQARIPQAPPVLGRRRRPSPMDTVDDYEFHDDGQQHDDQGWEYER